MRSRTSCTKIKCTTATLLAEVTSSGAKKNGIENASSKIITRGVLLDIPKFKGKPWLEPGEAIYPADLDGAAAMAKVSVEKGDIVIIRTGQIAQVRSRGKLGRLQWRFGSWARVSPVPRGSVRNKSRAMRRIPGEPRCCRTIPPMSSNRCTLFSSFMLGCLVGEIFDLEGLAADCAKDGVYEFMFVAPPLPITGAVGSPVNPQAIK